MLFDFDVDEELRVGSRYEGDGRWSMSLTLLNYMITVNFGYCIAAEINIFLQSHATILNKYLACILTSISLEQGWISKIYEGHPQPYDIRKNVVQTIGYVQSGSYDLLSDQLWFLHRL